MGRRPRVNLELVTDYAEPEGSRNRLRVRIHLEIPFEDPELWLAVKTALDEYDLDRARDLVLSATPYIANDADRAEELVASRTIEAAMTR